MSSASEKSNHRKIGIVSGLHGLKGEVYIHVFSKDISWINNLTSIIFEDSKGNLKPFDVKSFKPYKSGFLVFLVGINDRTMAESLRSHLVWVLSDLFSTHDDDESFYLAEIENFSVFDQGSLVGVISGFGTNSIQDLLIIKSGENTFEIPLIEEFLDSIDFDAKKVHLKLPLGLLESQLKDIK